MTSALTTTWEEFMEPASPSLFGRYKGWWRAFVAETNDPLNLRRIRIKIPEMHDSGLKPDECPWAMPAFDLGMIRCGSFEHACIGDIVWVTFEKEHPYAPIWHGFAPPMQYLTEVNPETGVRAAREDIKGKKAGRILVTGGGADDPASRVNVYGLEQIYNKGDRPSDKDSEEDYLPKDGRPMSVGRRDRYGNVDISSYVGYFPKEHTKATPTSESTDEAEATSAAKSSSEPPKPNEPDMKYMARLTKYGHLSVMSDVGYDWDKEFKGDVEKDNKFEIRRWKYYQKVISEDAPKERDQRRREERTRYGHLFEMRDTGWNKSRKGEITDDPVELSKDTERDLRWIKLRTKGGWLSQMYDKGFDPEEDEFVKRHLSEEHGETTEKETEHFGKDARFFRMVGRHGFKIVIDERGSDSKSADKKETPHGNGILLKGRRSGGRGSENDPRGFHFEFNENEDTNMTTWATPLGLVAQMNDDLEYVMLCSRIDKYTPSWKGIKENEFLRDSLAKRKAHESTHHLLLDHQNAMIRLKSRGYLGSSAFKEVNSPEPSRYQQGLEIHDGAKGDGAWVELIDGDNRGIWMHKKQGVVIIKSKNASGTCIVIDDKKNNIIISNTVGKIQLNARDIEIAATNKLSLEGGTITMKASNPISMASGSGSMKLDKDLTLSGNVNAMIVNGFLPQAEQGGGAGQFAGAGTQVDKITPLPLPTQSPTDRGKIYNTPATCSDEEIEHRQ